MDHLVRGIRQFQTQVFQREHDFYSQLAQGQSPSALVIGCSDSRVDPNLITQSGPGELFVMRNAGNMVPPYGSGAGGEAGTIEYAVSALGVRDIIVCGHSQCGAMKGLLNLPSLEKLPAVREWLRHAETTRRIIDENYSGEKDAERLLEITVREHVLVQIENLQTHPSVAAALQRGQLTLHGWVYGLEDGLVKAYCTEREGFAPLSAKSKPITKKDRSVSGKRKKV